MNGIRNTPSEYSLPPFQPGTTPIAVSGKVFDQDEIRLGQDAVAAGWWTEGEYAHAFEQKLRDTSQRRYVHLVNSGSSANLLAVAALTSDVFGSRALRPGDEFITTACSFPTTVNPGVLYGLTPVWVDIDIQTFNPDIQAIESAITSRTKLIMLAHTLGNPLDLARLMQLVKKHDLWLIEDCCDALGSKFGGRPVGIDSHIATYSFYPAHHITTGEGGALTTNSPLISRAIEQFRDWGRDCWCEPGKDNTCGKRFDWQLGDLPYGYDHKYIYSQIGYNLKMTDMQAAIGVAQMAKLEGFVARRKKNYALLRSYFEQFPEYVALPEVHAKADPAWFGFPFIVKKSAPFTRAQLVAHLEKHLIGTRPLFAGNLLRHPAYLKLHSRVIGDLDGADMMLDHACWMGVYPGIDDERLEYMKKILDMLIKNK